MANLCVQELFLRSSAIVKHSLQLVLVCVSVGTSVLDWFEIFVPFLNHLLQPSAEEDTRVTGSMDDSVLSTHELVVGQSQLTESVGVASDAAQFFLLAVFSLPLSLARSLAIEGG